MLAVPSRATDNDLLPLDALAIEVWRDATDLHGFPTAAKGAHYRWVRLQQARSDRRYARSEASQRRLEEMAATAARDLMEAPARSMEDVRCKLAYLDAVLDDDAEAAPAAGALGQLKLLVRSLAGGGAPEATARPARPFGGNAFLPTVASAA